jgi:signal transduction histidine kinase
METQNLALQVERDVDLRAELRTVHSITAGLLHDKPVTAELSISDSLPPICCDQRRVHQILLNLISNACKFTAQGTVTIHAETADGEVLISVADTGPGIKAEEYDAIFEPFRQTAAAIRVGEGIGLGLPIAKQLAEAHGGRLWMESIYGEGATFFVALPIDGPTT